MSKNAVDKENITSTAQGKVWSILLGVKKGTNEIEKGQVMKPKVKMES